MILPTMTLPELTNELLKDSKEVIARRKNFRPKFDHIRKRQVVYPWFWEATIQTKRRNNWYMGFYAYSKKDASIIFPPISIYFRYANATWAAFLIQQKDKTCLLLFSPHFFERYIERFLKTAQEEIQYPIKEYAKFFFLRNYHITPYKPETEDKVRGFCEDGMFLGEWLSEDVGLVKTFLSRDELKVNQYTEYYECATNWIIDDMYMSRTGCSLTTPEFDKLSDEWFSPYVWRDFIFRRDNPTWNQIFVDCMTFKKEHNEEYNLCSDMLEKIRENKAENGQ